MADSSSCAHYSIYERLDWTGSIHRDEILAVLSRLESKGKGFVQPKHLFAEFEAIPEAFGEVSKNIQEAVVLPPYLALAVRPRPGVWEHIRVNMKTLDVEELPVAEYLKIKEELIDGR
jgi:sucrose synthase